METGYQVWEDGFSPIVFVTLNQNNDFNPVTNLPELLSKDVMSLAKKLTKKLGKSFVLLNFSLLEFTRENIELIKEIKLHLVQPYLKALAVVSLRKSKFNINLMEE